MAKIKNYSSVCQDVDRNTDPDSSGMRMVRVSYMYFLSKFTEFADTFFFLARKKFEHVSFLQVLQYRIPAQMFKSCLTLVAIGNTSWNNAPLRLGSRALASWRSRNVRRNRQLSGARFNVLLLLPSISRTRNAKVLVLEKVPHDFPDDPGNPNSTAEVTPNVISWFSVCGCFREEFGCYPRDSGVWLPVAVLTDKHNHNDLIFRTFLAILHERIHEKGELKSQEVEGISPKKKNPRESNSSIN